MAQKTLLLNKEFGDNIFTRHKMSSFFKNINKTKEDKLILDFKNIRFISRSCVDEYLKLKEKSNKTITERNMSNDLKSMFRLVENQLRSVNFEFTKETPCKNVGCVAMN
ncbi:hypothetical protein GOV12_05580 [Candidatus Pacearchaeota archaeon]|nr:hypothetical protein [Candidatus Pacearchaeota archaeon]